ncbi:MAG TPA: T9SS type A sorting domain-containing protein [Chitinophagaceae bacterium]|mgnify:CR=1 FL=1|nr:T9SS type A sorting domain-containing protein [Chitinophagaceae bacterium]
MRRILPILSFILLTTICSQGQSSRITPVIDGNDRIVKLYPNPATSYITFDLQGNYKKGLSIYIYNGLLGKKMYEAANVQEKTTVTLNDFSRGMYIYHLIDETGKILESGKFQVSR